MKLVESLGGQQGHAVVRFLRKAVTVGGLLCIGVGEVAGDANSLMDVGNIVQAQTTSVGQTIVLISYVAGIALAVAGILQFKTHKENPSQTPLSKPITIMVVAAALLFLPTVINVAGQSVLGTSNKASNVKSVIEGESTTTH